MFGGQSVEEPPINKKQFISRVMLGRVESMTLSGGGRRARSILGQAEQEGDLRSALMANGQSRSVLDLLAKLCGQVDERPQLNNGLSGEWVALRAVLLDALTLFRAARVAVAGRALALGVER